MSCRENVSAISLRNHHIHERNTIGDDVKFSLSAMKRVVNKVLPLTGTDPNILAIQDGLQLQVFRHTYQNRTRTGFFWITRQIGLLPSQPSQRHSAEWEEECVLKRLILGARSHPLSTTEDMTTEPQSKQPKKASIAAGNIASNEGDLMVSSGGTTQATASLSPLRIRRCSQTLCTMHC